MVLLRRGQLAGRREAWQEAFQCAKRVIVDHAEFRYSYEAESLDETAKQLSERNRLTPEEAEKARETIAGLADRVLIGLTSVYNPETR